MPTTPVYIVKFNNNTLPGYLQTEDQPLNIKNILTRFIGSNGGDIADAGADFRKITLTWDILSTLTSASTGLQHLDNCMAQYRVALGYLTRTTGLHALEIHDTDRYLMAKLSSINAPKTSAVSRKLTYTASFDALPYYYSGTTVAGGFSGNTTATLVFPDTAVTYPVFSIPSGVTGFIATDSTTGKVLSFTRGAYTGTTITVDCGTFSVLSGSSTYAFSTMNSMNYGHYWSGGAGTMSIAITGFAGSGSVGLQANVRYEI